MFELLPSIPSMFAMVGTPIAGYLAKKTIDSAAALKAHIAADAVAFEAIRDSFTDLKNGQQNQTEKLDRLVEKLIPDAH